MLQFLSDPTQLPDIRSMRPHGIMFHHFHSAGHAQGQGSLSADELAAIIEQVGPSRILPARQWVQSALSATLKPDDVCLTFDDNLRCQYDVALPVLQAYGLTAFWFVYTSVCQGQIERLEIFRQFRTTCFATIDDFYLSFFAEIERSADREAFRGAMAAFQPQSYLRAYPFYSDSDRRFRFVRDEVLGPARYTDAMNRMIARSDMNVGSAANGLWMGRVELQALHRAGHVIGLHSHSHPTRLERLPAEAQRSEYQQNSDYLTSILGVPPRTMSHPCNSYNRQTLSILRELGIVLGFRANMQPAARSELEYPREDHANLVRAMAA